MVTHKESHQTSLLGPVCQSPAMTWLQTADHSHTVTCSCPSTAPKDLLVTHSQYQALRQSINFHHRTKSQLKVSLCPEGRLTMASLLSLMEPSSSWNTHKSELTMKLKWFRQSIARTRWPLKSTDRPWPSLTSWIWKVTLPSQRLCKELWLGTASQTSDLDKASLELSGPAIYGSWSATQETSRMAWIEAWTREERLMMVAKLQVFLKVSMHQFRGRRLLLKVRMVVVCSWIQHLIIELARAKVGAANLEGQRCPRRIWQVSFHKMLLLQVIAVWLWIARPNLIK